MRVVFDTNIFISAFGIPGGKAEEAYLHVLKGTFELITSIPILTETSKILKTKFDWSEEKIEYLLRAIGKTATVIKTKNQIHLLQDEPDNRILECALEGKAHFIVTGDKHLLSLKNFQEIPITKLSEFLTFF